MKEIEADLRLVKTVLAARAVLATAEQELSDDVMSKMPFKRNDIVRDVNTGARYRVDYGHAFLSGAMQLSCSLRCHRVYSTGRREARAISYISPHTVELVPPCT